MSKLNKCILLFLGALLVLFEIISFIIFRFSIKNAVAIFAGILITYICFILMQFFTKRTLDMKTKAPAMINGTIGYLLRASIYIVCLILSIKFLGKIPTLHLAAGYFTLAISIFLIYIFFPKLIKPAVTQENEYVKKKKINIFEKPVLHEYLYNGKLYRTFKRFEVRGRNKIHKLD